MVLMVRPSDLVLQMVSQKTVVEYVAFAWVYGTLWTESIDLALEVSIHTNEMIVESHKCALLLKVEMLGSRCTIDKRRQIRTKLPQNM